MMGEGHGRERFFGQDVLTILYAKGVTSQSPGSATVARRPDRHPGDRSPHHAIPQRGITTRHDDIRV